MCNVTNGSVANGGINDKLSNEIKNNEFLYPLSTIKNLGSRNVDRAVMGNLNSNYLPSKFN